MFDIDLKLKDSGLVDADAPGQVDGSDQILDLGAGLIEALMVIEVSELELESDDELYKISLQGSSKPDFSDTIEDLAILELGAAEVLGGDQDSVMGRYKVPVRTEKNGTIYPYVRLYTDVSGTIATGINFSAYLTKA